MKCKQDKGDFQMNHKKMLSILTAAALAATALTGCGDGQTSRTTGTAEQNTQATESREIGSDGVPGVEDEALAAKLTEEAADILYSDLCVNDPTCTNGILPPMYDSRADIDKAIPEDAGSYTPDQVKIGYEKPAMAG